MGPVSFEAIEAGVERDRAMVLAKTLKDAGIRVDLSNPRLPGGSFQLMVRSQDALRSRALIRRRERKRQRR